MNKNILVIGITILFLSLIFSPVTSKVLESEYHKEKCNIKADINMVFKIFGGNNSPPYIPTPILPDPVPIDVNLSWHGGDPDPENTVTYDVHFSEWMPGEEPPLIAIVGPYPANQTQIWYDIPELLEFNRKYSWKIVAFDNHGANTSSDMWIFTTEPNYPPDPAHDEIPPNGACNVPGDAILFWNGTDPNSGDELKYDLYFSINYPPIIVSHNQTETYYDPYGTGDMPLCVDYYWRIVTWDREGEFTSSPIWSFKTGPYFLTDPEIDGPNCGVPGIDYNFTFVSTHPDNMSFKYYVDWGDGNAIETDYHEAGEVVTLNHNWTSGGNYKIVAQAEDNYGERSGKSYHQINIQHSRTINPHTNLLSWLFNKFSLFEVFLREINLLRKV